MASARPPSVSPQARLSYLAISSILRGRHSRRPPVVCLAHRSSTLPVRRPFSTALRRNDGNGSYMRSDFANQGFTGYYEPREQTPGPLSGSSPTGAPKITPKLLKDHLDAFVVGQDRAKKALATAVYNHYQRIQELQRREEEEEELLAQQERRRMSEVHRHPVEGREGELKRGIRVPSLTADWPEEDEFPGQQATTSSSAIHMPGPGSVQKGGEWGPGGDVQSQQHQHQQQQSRHSPSMDNGPGVGSQGLVDNTPLTIEKSNILLLGPSGVGKTLMAKTLARVLEVPFSMSDCTPFTQAGYIGEDAEVCVQRLLAAANYDVARAERGIICLDEMDKIATAKVSHGKDVSGEGVQQALLKIIEGTTVQVQAKPERGSGSGSPGASAGRQQGFPTNSPLSGGSMGGSHSQSSAAPGKGEVYNVKTDNILFICAGAFNGLHKLILDRISKGSIGFGATVRATPGTNSSSSSSSDQHETILEGEDDLYTSHLPFYTPPPTSSPSHTPPPRRRKLNTLDLLEPQDLQTYGLIPELVGRIPLTCALSSLDIPSLVQVLTEPRNSLLQQYRQLFALSSIELRITTPALHVIASEAQKMGTGARGLRTVLERLLADAMFETPGSGVKSVLVTEDVARKKTGAVFFGRGEGEEFRSLWARSEERWEVEEEERRRREREEDGEGEGGEMEKRARNNSRGGAARTFEEYREKASAAGFG
ncbi:ClpX, ATPase regulatory subunit [Hortaea werneckii]|nr:ClpX, ATPase regulatory subunit [Hortaea werneckii]KAI7056183.1 ClpX, ATPase regulatory subunit [Hortaea werneckii]